VHLDPAVARQPGGDAAYAQRSSHMAGQDQQYFSNFTKSGTSTLLNV